MLSTSQVSKVQQKLNTYLHLSFLYNFSHSPVRLQTSPYPFLSWKMRKKQQNSSVSREKHKQGGRWSPKWMCSRPLVLCLCHCTFPRMARSCHMISVACILVSTHTSPVLQLTSYQPPFLCQWAVTLSVYSNPPWNCVFFLFNGWEFERHAVFNATLVGSRID